ncbi:MAG: FAD-dependent oxidoreductase [Terriglobales bacterium]
MKTVFVVGAGPAGLFAAQKIAQAGHQVIVFNRDIKPGGLAEYGIYVVKEKMKAGLRKQFAKVFSHPNLHYFGHVKVGTEYDVSIEELQSLNPDAIVFSCGAQGYNKLGLPGENAKGVYSAKDFVYFYNSLPPYSSQDFSTGRRIAIIGMGNVAVDIMRWLLQDNPKRVTEEVIVVARRGPFEAKFDEKEIEHVEMHLVRGEFLKELERVRERCAAVGQDASPEKVAEATFPFLKKADLKHTPPKLTFRFLSSPKEIIPGPDGRIQKLVVTENLLVPKGEGTAAKATNETAVLDVDTMIFAIGDKHDPKVGLPMGPDGYNTIPDPANPKERVFQVSDPQTKEPLKGFYVVGWARRASDGLVGIARNDGETGAAKVLEYLATQSDKGGNITPEKVQKLLEGKGIRVVTKADVELLGKAEAAEAAKLGLPSYKWGDDATMLKKIDEQKAQGRAAGAAAHD